jgi:RimJ/RimL family protein N-acetyltransferase
MGALIIEPVVLEGKNVRLEPLSMAHHAALTEIGIDEDIWRWVTSQVRNADDMRKYIEIALKAQQDGTALPFVTIEKATNRVVGSTRFGNIDRANRGVEIGWTWIGKPWQKTVINTEAKYLMLSHAFEKLGCIRVALKTDVLNEKSRNAILRLGAKQEGIFRNHMVMESGRIRDSVWFSITDREWPEVKAGLEEKLTRQYEAG